MSEQGTADVVRRGPLLLKVLTRFVGAALVMPALLYAPAGTLDFWQAHLFCASLFVPMLFVLVYLLIKDPELLDRRMRLKERDRPQAFFVKLSLLFFVVAFVVPGLDRRWHWSEAPVAVVLAADAVMLLGYALFIVVMRANTYASRVIEVAQGQKVIDAGPYSVVRHPMYVAAITMYLAMPLVLGSYWGLLAMAPLPALIAFRILNEERLLREQLPGYEEYTRRVRYRLVPFVW
jgi:protein-S-isoprenylcysteine O-methyltransferase Ste14